MLANLCGRRDLNSYALFSAPDPKSRTEGEQAPQQGRKLTYFGHRWAPTGTERRVTYNIRRNIVRALAKRHHVTPDRGTR